jgi:N utilization substance protein B
MTTFDIRHLARLVALQVLYEADLGKRDPLVIVKHYANLPFFEDDIRTVGYMAIRACYDESIPWDGEAELLLTDTVYNLPAEGYELLYRLITGVSQYQTVLDEVISTYAPEWPLEQMAVIERNVLRIALFEMFFSDHAPINVAISEAVRVVKLYGSDNAFSFVNGVLGKISEHRQLVRSNLHQALKDISPNLFDESSPSEAKTE